ncbi:MAG TPA: hypothetical protein PK668_05850 [Myxococcota bacterium]|nr:hypothetical protein [Myxococcota bacterium]HRY92636.1 hypothetical protein [Myxococcota bacterium]HSA23903.1 hypothetical protein [Myxococcota bacterium]
MTLSVRLAVLAIAVALLAPLAAGAQPLPFPPPPGVLFHAPPTLVDLVPGVKVVPNHEHEVFFFSGRYYMRADGHWYRSRGLRWRWRHLEPASVPSVLRNLANGHYRHWNPDRDRRHAYDGPDVAFSGRPTLVEIEPGLMVVPDYGHEVFYADGRYYLRHEGRWYRSRGNRWHWRLIGVDLLPFSLRNLKHAHGHYRHYRHDRDRDRDRHDRDRHDRDHHDGDRHDRDRHDGDRHDRDRHDGNPGRLHEADRPPEPGLHRADERRDRREDRRDERMDRRDDRRDDRKDNRKDRRDDRKDRRDDRKDKRKDRRDDRKDDRRDD